MGVGSLSPCCPGPRVALGFRDSPPPVSSNKLPSLPDSALVSVACVLTDPVIAGDCPMEPPSTRGMETTHQGGVGAQEHPTGAKGRTGGGGGVSDQVEGRGICRSGSEASWENAIRRHRLIPMLTHPQGTCR